VPQPEKPSTRKEDTYGDAQRELRGIMLQRLEEEVLRNPDVCWLPPSPVPDFSSDRLSGNEHLMPFSPPTRAINPMIQNSPFQHSPFSPLYSPLSHGPPQLHAASASVAAASVASKSSDSVSQDESDSPTSPTPPRPSAAASAAVAVGASPRDGKMHRRRLRSASCPDRDSSLVSSEA